MKKSKVRIIKYQKLEIISISKKIFNWSKIMIEDKMFTLENHTLKHKENTFFREILIFDQWSSDCFELIKQYQTPTAICGYLAISFAYLISEKPHTTVEEIEKLTLHIANSKNEILKKVEKVMKFIHNDRSNYTQEFKKDFKSEKEIKNYMQDWVANYEISDFMRKNQNEEIFFLRNIERDLDSQVKHEELKRISEEVPFKDELFFIEECIGNQFKNPKEWKVPEGSPIFIIDLGGHFGVLLKYSKENEQGLVLINTMMTSYVNRKIISDFYDTFLK
jgi:thioredoxin-related protein